MGSWVTNARMYAVTTKVESIWQELLERVAEEAHVALEYLPYPAPRPLEHLWSLPGLGAVLMCGYPIALELAPVQVIAAPIPRAPWAAGRPVYRTDLIVREDAPYQQLEDTFGGRAGWTVTHSHSGFNAFRHHLLAYRSPQRPTLYREMVGGLVTARNVLDAVRERRIDVGPVDAYWHMLITRHAPQLVEGVRVLTSTALAPIPAFVAAGDMPATAAAHLRAAFASAAMKPWFAELADPLMLDGFAEMKRAVFGLTLEWDREAKTAGYAEPA